MAQTSSRRCEIAAHVTHVCTSHTASYLSCPATGVITCAEKPVADPATGVITWHFCYDGHASYALQSVRESGSVFPDYVHESSRRAQSIPFPEAVCERQNLAFDMHLSLDFDLDLEFGIDLTRTRALALDLTVRVSTTTFSTKIFQGLSFLEVSLFYNCSPLHKE